MRKETYEKLERETYADSTIQGPLEHAAVSTAISLKRIADSLERMIGAPGGVSYSLENICEAIQQGGR